MGNKKERDPRVERLERSKKEIRENYSRIPFKDWFRRDPKPEKQPGVQLEKSDALAMILAALSLVIPWVLGIAAALALVIWVLKLAFGG